MASFLLGALKRRAALSGEVLLLTTGRMGGTGQLIERNVEDDKIRDIVQGWECFQGIRTAKREKSDVKQGIETIA